MEGNLIAKCRTCLKGDLKMNQLTMLVKGYSDKPTYCKLLQESVRLESPDEYEHLMPQKICTICCKELRKAYTFIRQAQFSNKILISFIEKQLSSTTQTPIVMPECRANDKEEGNSSQHNTKTNNLDVDSTNVLLQHIAMENATAQVEHLQHFSYGRDEEFCENDEYNSKRAAHNQRVTCFETKTVDENKLVEDIEQHQNENDIKNSVKIKTETNLNNYCAIDQTTQIIKKEASEEFLTESESEESERSEGHQKRIDNKNDLLYHVSVNEVPKIVNEESFSFLETNTNWSKESSMNQFEESNNNTDSENSEMADSNQTSIISEIKIKETHTEMQRNVVEMNKNGKGKAIKCPSCDHVAKNRHCLFYHKRTVHVTEEDKVKCHFCSYTHSFKHSVFTHMKNNHKQLITTLKAENKKLSTTNKDASTSTLLKEIPGNSEDEYSSDDNMPLQQKANNSTSNSKIRMDKTEEQSSDDEFIKKLLNMKKVNGYQCDKCGKICNNYNALYSHKQIHKTEEENLPCPQCERKFKQKFELKNHIKRTHEINHEAKPNCKTIETRITCEDCSFVTKTYRELDLHIRTNHPNRKIPKRFMCENCHFVTKTRVQLNLHVRIRHTGERPFKCDICSKSFARKNALKIHSYSHDGITFNCEICSKSFATNNYLSLHKRRHNMEEQACKDCGKVVKELDRHKRNCLGNDNKKINTKLK